MTKKKKTATARVHDSANLEEERAYNEWQQAEWAAARGTYQLARQHAVMTRPVKKGRK